MLKDEQQDVLLALASQQVVGLVVQGFRDVTMMPPYGVSFTQPDITR